MSGDTGRVLVILLVAALVGIWVARYRKTRPALVCVQCGTLGPAQDFRPGSAWVEAILFLAALGWVGVRWIESFMLPPAVAAFYSLHAWVLLVPAAYAIYRLAGHKKVCEACGAAALVPPETPAGRRILEDQRRPAAERVQ
jgi:hypothetical protein